MGSKIGPSATTNTTPIRIDNEVYDMLKQAKQEFVEHHPEFKKLHISMNKIMYECCWYYLNHKCPPLRLNTRDGR